MLGLDSEISIEGDPSKISNSSQHLPLDTKCTHSTKNISTLDEHSNIFQTKCSSSKIAKS